MVESLVQGPYQTQAPPTTSIIMIIHQRVPGVQFIACEKMPYSRIWISW